LPVPDFDNVAQTTTAMATTAAAMPTEFVHGRKDSLQKSASKSNTTSEPNKEKTSSQREHSQPSQEENTYPSEAGKKKRDHHEEEASAARRRGEKAAAAEKRKNRRVRWFPVVTGVVVFVSTFVALTIRAAPQRRRRRKAHTATAEADDYEVQKGDTLSIISRRTGHSWHELVQNNPHIANPDLIFPSEHLKL
jgi:LysM repeat protein